MLSYYSTGQFPKSLEQPSRFKNRQASKGDGESLYKRNFEDPEKHDFKTTDLGKNAYHKQYHKLNANYSDKYFGTQYNSTQEIQHNNRASFTDAARQQNLAQPSHMNNWKIVRERQFAERVQQPDAVEQGKVISKKEYQERITQGPVESKSANWMSRENMYEISRPLIRLDNDLKHQPLIKNVQTVSDDLPKWCLTTNKYYTPENYDQSKKSRKQELAKADILGNLVKEPIKDPNNKVFLDNPFIGQRFDKAKMVPFYERADRVRDGKTKDDLRFSKVDLKWKENTSAQRFEPKLPEKITHSEKPFFQQLDLKRNPNYPIIEKKVGESQIYKKIERDKMIQLKIGHGEPGTLNPVKY